MARQLKDSLTRTVNCPVTSEASEMSKRLPESVFKQEEGRGPGHKVCSDTQGRKAARLLHILDDLLEAVPCKFMENGTK